MMQCWSSSASLAPIARAQGRPLNDPACSTVPADEVPLHVNLGLALMRQGKNAESIAEVRRALELDPDMEPARAALRALGGG
jgi:Tfp pilus assembly protein PilF